MVRDHSSEAAEQRRIEEQLGRYKTPEIAAVVGRNIGTLTRARRDTEQRKTVQDRLADAMTAFSGSMLFVYLHAIWFLTWIAVNLGWLGFNPFDPYPFGLLTLIVSLEAIFLSTFVLISQNRMGEAADLRADLDLQINLLTEYELTRVLTLVDALADHFGLEIAQDPEIEELKKDVGPEDVLKEMEQHKESEARQRKNGEAHPGEAP